MLVSNVYFMNAYDFVLFHLYDDRGADLVAADKRFASSPYLNDLTSGYWIMTENKSDKIFCKMNLLLNWRIRINLVEIYMMSTEEFELFIMEFMCMLHVNRVIDYICDINY